MTKRSEKKGRLREISKSRRRLPTKRFEEDEGRLTEIRKKNGWVGMRRLRGEESENLKTLKLQRIGVGRTVEETDDTRRRGTPKIVAVNTIWRVEMSALKSRR